jgi:hypothetical protein
MTILIDVGDVTCVIKIVVLKVKLNQHLQLKIISGMVAQQLEEILQDQRKEIFCIVGMILRLIII